MSEFGPDDGDSYQDTVHDDALHDVLEKVFDDPAAVSRDVDPEPTFGPDGGDYPSLDEALGEATGGADAPVVSQQTLSDGSVLTYYDTDGDGTGDAGVKVMPNGHTVIYRHLGTPGVSSVLYDTQGRVVEVGVDLNADGQIVASESITLSQPVTPEGQHQQEQQAQPVDDDQSVIPAGQPGGPGYVAPQPDDDTARQQAIAEDVSHWFQQSTNYTCGPSAVTAVLADFFEINVPSEQEVKAWAERNGVIDPSYGMDMRHLVVALNDFGVPSTWVRGTMSLQDIDAYLEAGHAAIIRVDASEYWTRSQSGGRDNIWHFVRLVDVDYERGVAILSDSGVSNGRGLEVPLQYLQEAYADGNYNVIITNQPDEDVRAAAASAGDVAARAEAYTLKGDVPPPDPADGHPSVLWIGVTLTVEALRQVMEAVS
jgi:hypothetical protein